MEKIEVEKNHSGTPLQKHDSAPLQSVKKKAVLLGAEYEIIEGQTYARLEVKGKCGSCLYYKYDPYFYVDAPISAKTELTSIIGKTKEGEVISPKKIEEVERELNGNKKKLLKIYCNAPRDVPILEDKIDFPCYEYSIPFGRRVLMDLELVPLSIIHYERKGQHITKFLKSEGHGGERLNIMAFDLETHNPERSPRMNIDPIIMLSYSTGKYSGVITYKKIPSKDFVEVVESEKELL